MKDSHLTGIYLYLYKICSLLNDNQKLFINGDVSYALKELYEDTVRCHDLINDINEELG